MSDMFHDSNYSYNGQFIGPRIHGVMGGHGTWKTAGTAAAVPTYWKRTVADFYYRVHDGVQHRVPWTLSDPLGTNCPTGKQEQLASGVAAWQGLSESEKQGWRRLASAWGMYRGYTLFLSRYLKGQV
jgi:hypothetical protein